MSGLDLIIPPSGNNPHFLIFFDCFPKGLDRLKCHSQLRKFLEYEVAKYTDPKDSDLKKAVRDNLEAIDKQVTGNRLFRKYTNLSKHKKQERDKAMMILQPSRNANVENIVKVWNKSLQKFNMDADHEFIYTNALKASQISPKNLLRYSMYARLTLFMRLGFTIHFIQFTF